MGQLTNQFQCTFRHKFFLQGVRAVQTHGIIIRLESWRVHEIGANEVELRE